VKHLLTTAALVIALAAPAMAQTAPATTDTGPCVCTKTECTNACIRKADPEVIAALRKRFRDLDESEIGVLYDGEGGWDVIFWTSDAHRQCRLTPKRKLIKCRIIHA
jgi:hypothetical protein